MTEPIHRTYFQGKPIEGFAEVHEHVSPFRNYVAVLAALFLLTALTYGVSYADLGPASLPVAMAVAVVKAALVCLYFMHLRYDDRYHVFVFLSTLLFVAIFFTFTIFDLTSRSRLNEEQDSFFRKNDGNWSDAQHLTRPIPAEGEGEGHGEAEAGHGEAKAGAHDGAEAGAPAQGEAEAH